MACKNCGGYEDTHGKCYDRSCQNFRGLRKRTATQRKPINQQSKKAAAHFRQTKGMRHAPIALGQVCDHPGCLLPATDPHEIVAGTGRKLAMQNVRAMAWLCRQHHDDWQGEPYAVQVTRVCLSMIEAVNQCCGRNAVDADDVIIVVMQE